MDNEITATARIERVPLLRWLTLNRERFNAVCFDVDGTVVRGPRQLPGAADMMAWLRAENIPFILLTNDGNHSIREKRDLIRSTGLSVDDHEIVSCGQALEWVVQHQQRQGQRFFVMGELGYPSYAKLAGLEEERDPSRIDHCAGVIVGESNYDWESAFNAVINFFIDNPTAPFIVPNPDTYWPNSKGGIGVGAGGKARFIQTVLSEYGRPVDITYLGKPYRAIYDYALSRLKDMGATFADNAPPRRALMVGDSLKSDIKGAIGAGFSSALVLTGITDREHLELEREIKPDLVFEALG